MTDEKKIIKEAIDDIKPDVYMKTRLQAKIEEPKRKSAKSLSLRLAVPLRSPCLQVSALTV